METPKAFSSDNGRVLTLPPNLIVQEMNSNSNSHSRATSTDHHLDTRNLSISQLHSESEDTPEQSTNEDIDSLCNWRKKMCVGAHGIMFVIFGITILSSFISYIHNEFNVKCLNLNVDLEKLDESRANYSITLDPWLINNPEMIFYDSYCKHKVINIFGDFPCNCRILALRSSTPKAYGFNQNDLESMLLRFDNLEGMSVDFSTEFYFFESRLNGTFYVSQEMLKNPIHLTTLLFAELNFKYLNGLEQVKNLEIFSIRSSFEKIEFPFDSIGTLSNLKVLQINRIPGANNTYMDSSICNLKQLIYFELDFMQYLSQVPFDCISKLDDLFYFAMVYMFLIEEADPTLWNMNSIRSIFLDFNSLKQSNFDFDTFGGFSSKLEKVSIQAPNDVCQSYLNSYQNIIIDEKEYSGFGYLYDNSTKIKNNNIQLVPHYNGDTFDYNSSWYNLSFVSDSDSSGLLKFIKTYDPCSSPCNSGISSYLCPTKEHGDGVCQVECNIAACGFDGGDCDQSCNLYTNMTNVNSSCTLDNWQMDGICNVGCNNSLCNYDFQDCIYTPTANDTCNNLLHDIENITCYSDWTDDLWCDSYCEQLSCEGTNSGCSSSITPCWGDGSCSRAYGTMMKLLAAIYQPYELITLNEVCEKFNLLALVTQTNIDNLNCSQAFDIADLNDNGYIGFWEAIVYTAESWGLRDAVHWKEKIQQIDCSSCLANASLYWW